MSSQQGRARQVRQTRGHFAVPPARNHQAAPAGLHHVLSSTAQGSRGDRARGQRGLSICHILARGPQGPPARNEHDGLRLRRRHRDGKSSRPPRA